MYELKKIPGDGSCFFAATAQGLNSDISHQELRMLAVAYLRSAKELHVVFAEGSELGDLDTYCKKMEQSTTTWASEPIIRATAELKNIHLVIYDNVNRTIPNIYHYNDKPDIQIIYLIRTGTEGSEHYDLLIPKLSNTATNTSTLYLSTTAAANAVSVYQRNLIASSPIPSSADQLDFSCDKIYAAKLAKKNEYNPGTAFFSKVFKKLSGLH